MTLLLSVRTLLASSRPGCNSEDKPPAVAGSCVTLLLSVRTLLASSRPGCNSEDKPPTGAGTCETLLLALPVLGVGHGATLRPVATALMRALARLNVLNVDFSSVVVASADGDALLLQVKLGDNVSTTLYRTETSRVGRSRSSMPSIAAPSASSLSLLRRSGSNGDDENIFWCCSPFFAFPSPSASPPPRCSFGSGLSLGFSSLSEMT